MNTSHDPSEAHYPATIDDLPTGARLLRLVSDAARAHYLAEDLLTGARTLLHMVHAQEVRDHTAGAAAELARDTARARVEQTGRDLDAAAVAYSEHHGEGARAVIYDYLVEDGPQVAQTARGRLAQVLLAGETPVED